MGLRNNLPWDVPMRIRASTAGGDRGPTPVSKIVFPDRSPENHASGWNLYSSFLVRMAQIIQVGFPAAAVTAHRWAFVFFKRR